jgi:hypothetical protein
MTHAARQSTTHTMHQSSNDDDIDEHYSWDKERGEAVRPFRLWDAVKKENVRWRYFADKKRAHMAALVECRWLAVGATIEVYDCRTGKLLGQYTRRVDSIRFMEG